MKSPRVSIAIPVTRVVETFERSVNFAVPFLDMVADGWPGAVVHDRRCMLEGYQERDGGVASRCLVTDFGDYGVVYRHPSRRGGQYRWLFGHRY